MMFCGQGAIMARSMLCGSSPLASSSRLLRSLLVVSSLRECVSRSDRFPSAHAQRTSFALRQSYTSRSLVRDRRVWRAVAVSGFASPAASNNVEAEDVLQFWFRDADAAKNEFPMQFWFMGGEEADKEIKGKFGNCLELAIQGKLDHWKSTPRGRVAPVLLSNPLERHFLYMPLKHSETSAVHVEAQRVFQKLADEYKDNPGLHKMLLLSDPSQYPSIVDAEWKIICEKLEKCVKSGAKIVLSRLASGEVLGQCELFEERQVGNERFNIFTGCPGGETATIVLRGGADQEAERSLHDAIMIVRRALKNSNVVAGGGAIDMELSRYLRQHARTIAGKSQLFINSYAKALEVIPRQLCDNAGFDATDVLNKLRQKHALASGEGTLYGVDINSGGIIDTYASFVWEPSVVKINALTAATEAACVVLSVDETIKNPKSEAAQAEGMGGGRGRGMGGMRGGRGGRGMRRR